MSKPFNVQPAGNISNLFFMLILLCAFTVTALIVVMTGANVYKTVSSDAEDNSDLRIPLSYTAAKIRSCDASGAVVIETIENKQVLVLKNMDGGVAYETLIYEYEGQLFEVTMEAGTDIHLADGMQIMAVHKFDMQMDPSGMLHIIAGDKSGRNLELALSLRSN